MATAGGVLVAGWNWNPDDPAVMTAITRPAALRSGPPQSSATMPTLRRSARTAIVMVVRSRRRRPASHALRPGCHPAAPHGAGRRNLPVPRGHRRGAVPERWCWLRYLTTGGIVDAAASSWQSMTALPAPDVPPQPATAGGDDMPPDSRDELFAREAAVGGRARRTLLCGHGVRVCRVS